MRYPATEKLEIIRTVEGSHLPTKMTLDMLGIPRTTFYRWYDRYVEGGLDALADRAPRPKSVWNRIPQGRRDDLIEFALEHEALTTRELAVKYTDEKRYFISESSAYRILKAADLITAPEYVVIKAAEEFSDKTTAINQMWQTDFTYSPWGKGIHPARLNFGDCFAYVTAKGNVSQLLNVGNDFSTTDLFPAV